MKKIIFLCTLFLLLASFAFADERTSSGDSFLSSLVRLFFPFSQSASCRTIHADEDMIMQKGEDMDKGEDSDISLFRRGHRMKHEILPVPAKEKLALH